jgi:hypothetical protein
MLSCLRHAALQRQTASKRHSLLTVLLQLRCPSRPGQPSQVQPSPARPTVPALSVHITATMLPVFYHQSLSIRCTHHTEGAQQPTHRHSLSPVLLQLCYPHRPRQTSQVQPSPGRPSSFSAYHCHNASTCFLPPFLRAKCTHHTKGNSPHTATHSCRYCCSCAAPTALGSPARSSPAQTAPAFSVKITATTLQPGFITRP